jgi:hypothetical protein
MGRFIRLLVFRSNWLCFIYPSFDKRRVMSDLKNTFRINEIYAFCSQDEDGHEGVIAFNSRQGMMPMVAADKARIDSLREIAKQLKGNTTQKIVLLKFSVREEIEEI